MISVAPSFVPQQSGISQPSMSGMAQSSQSGLSQPTMSDRVFFSVHARPIHFGTKKAIHFGAARPVLSPGFHQPTTGGPETAPPAPSVGGIIDFYDNDTT